MFKNYFNTTIKNLLKNRLYSAINIVGLSVGLAACILIALYVLDETSYDKHWSNAERIYRLNSTYDFTGDAPRRYAATSYLALPAMIEAFSGQIELGSRVIQVTEELSIGNQPYEITIDYVEADYLDMFSLKALEGDLSALFADPANLAISEAQAVRLFGDTEVIGEVVTSERAGNATDFHIAAVYRLPDANSVLEPAALAAIDPVAFSGFESWTAITTSNYVQLAPGTSVDSLSARFPSFVDANVDFSDSAPGVPASTRVGFDLQNIKDLHLHSPFDTLRAGGNGTVVMAFAAIAVLVLLIGCINFTILSTAKATQRAREVGMRKTVGASRGELVLQFLGESFLIVLFAILLALVGVELLLPFFETLVGRELNVRWTAPQTWFSLMLLFAIVSLIGGLYPAFVMSRFRPSRVLSSGRASPADNSAKLRNALVVFQFGISIVLIAATAVIHLQVNYSANRDPGFTRENVLVVDNLLFRAEANAAKQTLKQEVSRLPGVISTSLSVHQPTQRDGMANLTYPYTVRGEGGASNVGISTVSVDADFFATYEIPLLAGRNFDASRDQEIRMILPPPEGARYPVILNESAARALGFDVAEEALGRELNIAANGNVFDGDVVGVVPDTQFFSLRTNPRAEVYIYSPRFTEVLHVRYEGNTEAVLSSITRVWKELVGDAELTTKFVDQSLAAEFTQEQTEAKMLLSFSLLAVAIACLGLYGSAAFAVDRRTREIGVRKVMGAEIRDIVNLLMWEFSRPVLAANLIAWPVAAWAMLTWLQQFPYQIESLVLVSCCVLAGAIALSIAWLTVMGNTVKVATTNPVYALRYE